MSKLDPKELKQGDCLLYFENSLVDWIIAVKTYTRIGHIEIYSGANLSVASRNGIGVNRYQLRLDGLMAVRRPKGMVDYQAAEKWFCDEARGQRYDFKGLLCFTLAVKKGSPHEMYCSEFALNWYRHAGFEPFNPQQNPDKTPPSLFWVSSEFDTVWQKEGFKP